MIDVLVVGGIFRELMAFDLAPRERLGGSGLTAATAARHWDAEVALAGAIGSSQVAAVSALLEAEGIGSHLSVTQGHSGTFAYPAAASASQPWPLYRPAEGPAVVRPDLPKARVVLIFGVPDVDPVADGWVDDASREAIVLWDRQGWLSRARDDAHILALRPASRIYVANVDEAAADARADEQWTLEHQPPPGYAAAFIKRGAAGVSVYEYEKDRVDVPAYSVHSDGTLGSGDAFAGAAAAALAGGRSLEDAARIGCAMAAALIESTKNLVDANVAERARQLLQCRN